MNTTSLRHKKRQTGKMLRNALLLGVSAIAVDALSTAAFAQGSPVAAAAAAASSAVQTAPQDTPAVSNSGSAQQSGAPQGPATDTTLKEVIVTGLRGSLQRNLDIKRQSTGIVDAISSEDIGKFPDSNLAAAIQRIPGISISRGESGNGTTSNGDATEITVRGFGPTFNETLYDDRQISSGTSNKGFDFSAVGADFVGEVDVLKTPDASLSSGAIGATINIKYPKPFDHPGPRMAGSFSETYSPENGHATPNGGVLLSDTFLNDTVGLLADFAYSDHKTLADHESVQGWIGTTISPAQLAGAAAGASNVASINAWLPREFQALQEATNTSREDARLVFQWKPTDRFLLTLNDDYSRERITSEVNGLSVWFNNGAPITPTNIVQGKDGTVRSFMAPNSPTDLDSQVNKQVLENNEYGINAKYDVTDNFTVMVDLDRAESQLNPNGQQNVQADIGYGNSSGGPATGTNSATTGVILGQGLPFLSAYGPNGNVSQFNNPAIIGSHVMVISSTQNDDVVSQGKIMGTWKDDNLTLRFGTQFVGDHEQERGFNTQQNSNWQAYSGYGPASGSATGVAIPASLLGGSFSTNNFLPGNSTHLPPQILKYSAVQVVNYLQSLGNPKLKTIPGFNAASAPNYAGVFSLAEVPGSHINVSEDSWSFFLTASQKSHIGSMPLTINVGGREEITRTKIGGLGQQLTGLTPVAGDSSALSASFGPTTNITAENVQSHFLPNIDLNLDVTDKIKVRLDASQTLTHPLIANLSPVLTVGASQRIGGLSARGGNPNLLPYTSDNFDLGVEWYYQRNSYISVDGFVKHVSNFTVAGATRQTINGVIDPSTGAPGQFAVTSQVNGPDATVHGVEAAIQHTFADTGFGFQLNTTLVGSDKPYDKNNLSVSGFAVTGLANSANMVAFYDKHGFQSRVAVNWRNSYLDHFGQAQGSNLFGSEPTYVDSNITVDFSTSYEVTKNLSVYFEALNLSDSGYYTHGRFSEQFLDGVNYGRKFTLGAHLRL